MLFVTHKHSLFLIILFFLIVLVLISCGQGSSKSLLTGSTPTSPSPTPTICSTCITIGTPSLTKLAQQSQQGMVQYQLNFVVMNNQSQPLNEIVLSINMDAKTDTFTFSSTSSTNVAAIPAHGQATYHFGDPSDPAQSSSISLSDPPPSSLHIVITLATNSNIVATWDGRVAVPA